MSIGERIKRRRQELGMSVDEVAEKLNKNRATIYRYESDEIENLPLSILEPLSKVLNVSPAYLMGWDEKEEELETKLDEDIFTKAAHKVGHEGPLTEEEKEKIALAIKIALARNNK